MRTPSPSQLLEANRAALRTANDEIALYAGELAHHFLAGCFPTMMYVERSSEVAEPGPFDLSMEPERLETRRMTARHWQRFELALVSGDLLARRYVQELEYEFVLALDISRSFTGSWLESVAAGEWREDVCFRLKYLACALLNSAVAQNFACRVIFVDQGRTSEVWAREDESIAHAVLEQLDELIALRQSVPERLWLLEGVLQELAASSANLLVAVVSDFLDPVQDHGGNEELMLSVLSRLRHSKRLMVLQVNRERDLCQSRLRSESQAAMTYGEESGRRKFSPAETAERRARYCRWLGGPDGSAGRLETYLATENVPFQKFFKSDDMNARLEELACAVLQV